MIKTVATTTITLIALTGCGGTTTATPSPAVTVPASAVAPQAPVSDIDAAVQKAVTALDALNIQHTEPLRAEVGLSGAKARFDMTVNGYDAGINVFANAEALATWQSFSDSLGGIHVAYDLAVLTLNSSEGVANSAEIAPKIAAQIGGQARGV
jgi:hypothetical protein